MALLLRPRLGIISEHEGSMSAPKSIITHDRQPSKSMSQHDSTYTSIADDQRSAAESHDAKILVANVGLRLPDSLAFEAWEQAGRKLYRIADSSAWCLGDWLVYGQDRYQDRYQRTLESAGLDYQTLRNYAWVARKFDIGRRHENISFQHHAEVASLTCGEQDEWLNRAESLGWSRNRLRRELRQHRKGERSIGQQAALVPKLRVTEDAVRRWRAAADRASTDFEAWIIHVLDEAAADEFGLEIARARDVSR